MLLIKDLGVIRPTNKSKYTRHTAIFECSCGVQFKADVSAVRTFKIYRCKQCSDKARNAKCPINFISKCRSIHKNRYDYSKVVYYNKTTPITLICKVHGEFQQTPATHLRGGNCQKCAQDLRSIKLRASNINRPATLYYAYFKELNLYKIGVTTRMSERFNGEAFKPIVLHTIDYDTEAKAYLVERALKVKFDNLLYKGPRLLKRKGNTELLTEPIDFIPSVETIENTDEFNRL